MAKPMRLITLLKKRWKDKFGKRLQKILLNVVLTGRLIEKMADHFFVNRAHPLNNSAIFYKYMNKF